MIEHTKWSLPEKFTGVLEDMAQPVTHPSLAEQERDAIAELNHAQWLALENVRCLASRNRKEEWAKHMLRFVDEAGTNKAQIMRRQVTQPKPEQATQHVPDGWALVHTVTLRRWKDQVNEVAALSLKKERWATGAALKREIAEMIAAAPQPVAQPDHWVNRAKELIDIFKDAPETKD